MLKSATAVAVLLLVPWGLHLLKKRLGAPTRYYMVLGSLLLVPAFLKTPVQLFDQVPMVVSFAVGTTVFLLPPLALAYSVQALMAAPRSIPLWVSIPGLLLSGFGVFVIFILAIMSRASYLLG